MSRKITQHGHAIKVEEDYDGAGVGEEGRTSSGKDQVMVEAASCGRERLKRHRIEIAGRVWIPDTWGQEELLKDWIDCSAFDSSLFQAGISSARKALVEECRRANPGGFAIGNQC